MHFSYRETEKDRKTVGPKKDLKNKRISNEIRRRKYPASYRGEHSELIAALSPVTWSKVGVTRHLLKKASVSGSTTSSRVTLPPALIAATTSECVFPSTNTAFTW